MAPQKWLVALFFLSCLSACDLDDIAPEIDCIHLFGPGTPQGRTGASGVVVLEAAGCDERACGAEQPLAVGFAQRVRIAVLQEPESTGTLTVESSAPERFSLLEVETIEAQCGNGNLDRIDVIADIEALAAGDVELIVRDDGREIDRIQLTVAQPVAIDVAALEPVLGVGSTTFAAARALDSAGHDLIGFPSVDWTTSTPELVSFLVANPTTGVDDEVEQVSSAPVVQLLAMAKGEAQIEVRSGALAATLRLTIEEAQR
jgi:hypothetical protein